MTIIDATSAALVQSIAWDECDVVIFSRQRVRGGKGAHEMRSLSPRAVARLEGFRLPARVDDEVDECGFGVCSRRRPARGARRDGGAGD